MDGEALELRRKTHRTIQRVTDDLAERIRFNTAVAAIMELINQAAPLTDSDAADPHTRWALREAFEVLARLIAPFAPHFAEELWHELGGAGYVTRAAWPEADAALLVEEQVTLVVQVCGKLRGRVTIGRGASEEQALAAAQQEPRVAAHLDGKTLRRVIYVQDKLLNLVAT